MARRKRALSPSPTTQRQKTDDDHRPPSSPTKDINKPNIITASEYTSDPANAFELCTTRAPNIRCWFDNLKHVLGKTDVNFVLTKDGIDVSHADVGKNVVIVAKLFGKEFEFYRCDARISAGVDVRKLNKIIHFAQANEILTMQIRHDKPGTLIISTFNAPTGCRTTYTYELIEEVPDEEVKMPDFAFPRSISVPSTPFQKKVHDMELYGVELVEIQSIRNKLILRNYNSPTTPIEVTFAGKARVLSKNSTDILNNGGNPYDETDMTAEIYQGVFNLKYISDFVKKPGVSEEMNFFIRNDFPLLIQFNVSSLGYLRIFIMPVVKNT